MSAAGGGSRGSVSTSAPKAEECVKVVVRIRPLSQKEIQDGRIPIAEANEGRGEIIVRNPKLDEKEAPKSFTFDAVFGDKCTQKGVYETCAAPVVESVLNGYNGTIFAYGQTGAGKTHTMEGYPDPPDQRGIIPNSFKHIFDRVAISENQQFLVRASYLEIYNEEIRDLLSKDPRNRLELKENADTGVYVKDLTSFVVKSAQEIDNVMQAGKKNRSVGATLMNQTSSRSHSIFTIIVECASLDVDPSGKQHIRVGKLNLVDLAGSERQSKTGATGDRLKEATKINLSLSALGNVISALVDGKSQYIPYRDSKLTRLLMDSLGGNTKTVMCANCGPAEYNYDETISTLRYANRAKNIKNKPRINEDPKDAMLREFQEEIQRLRAQLAAQDRGMAIVDGKEVPLSQVAQMKGDVIEKVVEKVVEREVRVDLSEEKVRELEAKAQKEKDELQRKAKQDIEDLVRAQAKTVEEREALRQRLQKEAEDRASILEQKSMLQDKLKAMQEKLIQGGEILDKAAKQEAMLRKARLDLDEQEAQKLRLARELAEKEEAHITLEEHYSSLQEEVEVKTKKLKKLWNKWQAANREVQDLQEEFQREREDMLDTIRQLTRQLKLKDVIITNFVPPEESKKIERRSKWNEELDSWIIARLEFSGNNIRPRRPVSSNGLRRPETDYARSRKAYEKNPRYKYDNIISLDLDMPEGTTQNYMGPDMVSNVSQVLSMGLDADGEEVVYSGADMGQSSPYMQYGQDDDRGVDVGGGGGGGSSERPKSAKKTKARPKTSTGGGSSSSGRPKGSATRREDGGEGRRRPSLEDEEFKGYEEHYPSARGLVGK